MREEDNERPRLRRSKRTVFYFKHYFGPASRGKDNNVAALADLLEEDSGSKKQILMICGHNSRMGRQKQL